MITNDMIPKVCDKLFNLFRSLKRHILIIHPLDLWTSTLVAVFEDPAEVHWRCH